MVKLWGYTDSTGKRVKCPGGMFSTQTLGRSSSALGSVRKVIMKLPKPYDIQRLILARHFMYLRHPEVRYGKHQSPKDFEAKLAEFRKEGIDARASGVNGGKRKEIRRNRVIDETDQDREIWDGPPKWDIDEISFKNILPDIFKDMMKKSKAKERIKTHQQMKAWVRKNRDEEYERQQWLGKLIRDMKSDRMNEILANYRMVTQNGTAIGPQPAYTIYLESAVYALKTHDWTIISKCLCGMVEQYQKLKYMRKSGTFPTALNVFWMLGFLTVVNHYKDDVSKVEQFARNVHTLLGGNPLWIASHLAVWMIQKGYFLAAYRIVDEYSLDRLSQSSRYRNPKYGALENPKRDMAIFFTQMIKAVYHYSIWKKESTMPTSVEDDDDIDNLVGGHLIRIDALKRKGETALGAFELCYEKYKVIEGDAMCFLQPFIELVLEFRSVLRAREIIEEVFNLNDGNLFVEEFYIEFLEEHYSHLEDDRDLIRFLKGRTARKFNFKEENVKEKVKQGRRQIKQWKERKLKSRVAISTMKKISRPAFSW